MIDRPIGEAPADREAGVAGADDDGGNAFDGSAPLRDVYITSTVTFTGLVITS